MAPDPKLVEMINKAAAATGADPKALLATSIVETGGRFGAVGDNGTSYGPFMFHKGGALGTHDSKWANSYEAVLNRAQEFAKGGVHHGKGAAAVQRPADQAGYQKKVDSVLAGLTGTDSTSSKASVTPSKTLSGAGNGNLPPDPFSAQMTSQLPLITSLLSGVGKDVHQPGLEVLNAFQQNNKSTAPLTGAAPKNAPGVDIPLQTPNAGLAAAQVAGPQAAKIVGLAQQYIGTPYKWGGSDPKNGFDCSGFVQFLYKKNGIELPRTTYDQVKAGVAVPKTDLQPGDILFFNTHGSNTHEGMYIGNGKFIQAPHTGDVVKISNLSDPYYSKHFSTARRVTGGTNAK